MQVDPGVVRGWDNRIPPPLPPLLNVRVGMGLAEKRDPGLRWVEQAVEFNAHLINLHVHPVVERAVGIPQVLECSDKRPLHAIHEAACKGRAGAQQGDAFSNGTLPCLIAEPVNGLSCS